MSALCFRTREIFLFRVGTVLSLVPGLCAVITKGFRGCGPVTQHTPVDLAGCETGTGLSWKTATTCDSSCF